MKVKIDVALSDDQVQMLLEHGSVRGFGEPASGKKDRKKQVKRLLEATVQSLLFKAKEEYDANREQVPLTETEHTSVE